MRKFKLKDRAAERMRGLENTAFGSRPAEKDAGGSGSDPAGGETLPKKEIRVIIRTDIGLVRKSNQDAAIVGHGLMGVADGMGGHQGGETASAGARDGMLRETAEMTPTRENLEKAIRRVNLSLWEQQLQEETLRGMGTTLTVLWPAGDMMLVGQVGDSRAYLLRGGELRQVTEDHSMVAEMVRQGMLTEEQAACHPMRNYITRAVGTEDDIQADILQVSRAPGDRWLICSDGLHSLVGKERLRELLSAEDLDEGADQMIREALDRGGKDNITLVIAEDPGPERPQEDPEKAGEQQSGQRAGEESE